MSKRALKAQRTREALVSATISLIREGGFAAASSSKIAERAEITWGAAQHHFGTKEEILDAVLALAYDKFLTTMAAPSLRVGTLEDRVGKFVDRMWMHYQTDVFLVTLEILLATRADKDHPARAWEERHGKAHLQVVREIFYDSKISQPRMQEVLTFLHFSLTGMCIEGAFEAEVINIPRHLHRLKTNLVLTLTGQM